MIEFEDLMMFFLLSLLGLIIFGVLAFAYCSSPTKILDINSRCYSVDFVKKKACNEHPDLAYCKSIFTEEK